MSHAFPDPPSTLIELAYKSIRPRHVSEAMVVDGIVLPSIRRNRELNVSGCLWVGPDCFVQLLEGPADAVDSLYERIEVDPRHSDVTLLVRQPIPQRRYKRFGMRLIDVSDHDDAESVIATLQHDRSRPIIELSTPRRFQLRSMFRRFGLRPRRLTP